MGQRRRGRGPRKRSRRRRKQERFYKNDGKGETKKGDFGGRFHGSVSSLSPTLGMENLQGL
jgi:hypothetical protein